MTPQKSGLIQPSRFWLLYDKVVFYIANGMVGLIAIVFLRYLLPRCRPYPYSDEWTYCTPLRVSTAREFMVWVLSQHVDHRIPLQKISSYLILRVANFDFRYQVAFNFMIASLLTLMLLFVARQYRGYQSLGDVCIPLTTLSFSAGFSVWGFQFQFLSSIFFTVCFLTACVTFANKQWPLWLDLAALSLILCAMCGLNGLVASSVLAPLLLAWLVRSVRTQEALVRPSVYGLLTISLILSVTLWRTWTPSSAAHASYSTATIGRFVFGLIASSLGVYGFTGTGWKLGLLIFLLVAGYLELGRRFVKGVGTIADFAMGVALLSSLTVLGVVAVGRSAYHGGWSDALAFHYGYLAVLVPLVSWIAVTVRMSRRASLMASLPVVVLFGMAFLQNARWRFDYTGYAAPRQLEILAAFRKPIGPAELANKYILDFYFADSPWARSQVTEGIRALKVLGLPIYGSPVYSNVPPVAIAPESTARLATGDCQMAELVGFHNVENWGVWFGQDPAAIKPEHAITGPLEVNVTAYAINDHTAHVVNVTIGGETKSISLTPETPRTYHLQYTIPKPASEIVLSGIKPVSPKDAGLGSDARKLAVGLVRIDCAAQHAIAR